MNELLISTPLLSTFDFFAVAFFILMVIYLIFHFYIAKYSGIKCGSEIQILSVGYFFTALLILIKAIVLNDEQHTLLEKPYPFILLFSLQLYLTSIFFVYQKISKRSIFKFSLSTFVLLFIVNILLIKLISAGNLLNALNGRIFISIMMIINTSVLVFVNALFLRRAFRILFFNIPGNSDLRNNIFMFIITSLLMTTTIVLFLVNAIRLYHYMVFTIFILISVIHVISSINTFHSLYFEGFIGKKSLESKLIECPTEPYSVKNNKAGHYYEESKIEEIKSRLIKLFEEQKPFLKPNLTINEVSQSIYTNKTYLSRVINEAMNKNFSQLLNYYRIEEAKSIFYSNMSISMDDLCVKSGFGSMAAFTIAFRIYAGTTPSDWCKEQKEKLKVREDSRIS